MRKSSSHPVHVFRALKLGCLYCKGRTLCGSWSPKSNIISTHIYIGKLWLQFYNHRFPTCIGSTMTVRNPPQKTYFVSCTHTSYLVLGFIVSHQVLHNRPPFPRMALKGLCRSRLFSGMPRLQDGIRGGNPHTMSYCRICLGAVECINSGG